MPHEVWEEGVQNGDGVPSGNRVSVYEAAKGLGDIEDTKRKRIQRGTIPHERDDSRALLDASSIVPDGRGDYRTAPDNLREQIRYLREILSEERDARRRVDTIIAQLTQTNAALAARVAELEPPESQWLLLGLRRELRMTQRAPGSLGESRWQRLFKE